jgi:hypothetical protein
MTDQSTRDFKVRSIPSGASSLLKPDRDNASVEERAKRRVLRRVFLEMKSRVFSENRCEYSPGCNPFTGTIDFCNALITRRRAKQYKMVPIVTGLGYYCSKHECEFGKLTKENKKLKKDGEMFQAQMETNQTQQLSLKTQAEEFQAQLQASQTEAVQLKDRLKNIKETTLSLISRRAAIQVQEKDECTIVKLLTDEFKIKRNKLNAIKKLFEEVKMKDNDDPEQLVQSLIKEYLRCKRTQGNLLDEIHKVNSFLRDKIPNDGNNNDAKVRVKPLGLAGKLVKHHDETLKKTQESIKKQASEEIEKIRIEAIQRIENKSKRLGKLNKGLSDMLQKKVRDAATLESNLSKIIVSHSKIIVSHNKELKATKDALLDGTTNEREKAKSIEELAKDLIQKHKRLKDKTVAAKSKMESDAERITKVHTILRNSSESMEKLQNKPPEVLATALVEKYKRLKERFKKRTRSRPSFSESFTAIRKQHPIEENKRKMLKPTPEKERKGSGVTSSSATGATSRPSSVP